MDKLMYRKRGQISGVVSAIIALVVGIGVSVIVLIFVGVLGAGVWNAVESDLALVGRVNLANDTFTALNGTAVQLDFTNLVNGTLGIQWANSTTIGLPNFTIDYGAGQLTLLTNNTFGLNGSALNASYDHINYSIQIPIREGIVSSFAALEATGTYLPIIVLAVVISLVLALIIGFTGLTGGRSQGGAVL